MGHVLPDVSNLTCSISGNGERASPSPSRTSPTRSSSRFVRRPHRPPARSARIASVFPRAGTISSRGGRARIRVQDSVWTGNSSHFSSSRITSQSIGRYQQYLSPNTDRFVQALCWHEMQRFGYPTEVTEEEVPTILSTYQETEPLARPELAFYVWSDARLVEEQTRWQRLRTRIFAPSDFIFETAFQQLCRS